MPRETGTQTTRTLVVVGNGMVGHRFCERMLEHDVAQRWRIVVFGEETRPAYDRVHLSEFFAGRTADELQLADAAWYAERGITLHLGERVADIDRTERVVVTDGGRTQAWDALVLATGSAPFVPPLPGVERDGVFVYRTIDDLERIQAWGQRARSAAVIGGGLLGLEAAKAVHDMGLETHVVEFAPRLMPRQVDAAGGDVLRRAIEALGVHVHTGVQTEAIEAEGLRLAGGHVLPADMIVVSAGIRPRDELARRAGLTVGERGGIVVDPTLATNEADVYAIGESALCGGMIYGLVAPGYEMADVLAQRLCGGTATFTGADLSTKLKLLGVDVASFGDAFADETLGTAAHRVVFEDRVRGVYQKLVVSAEGRLLGGVLVGDATPYASLLVACREGRPVPEAPHELLFGTGAPVELGDDSQVCACNNVSKADICRAIADGALTSVAEVKTCTKAGTGCGGCVPIVKQLLDAELARSGQTVDRSVCEHFAYTRQQLFEIVKLGRIASFDALLASHGRGGGCEVCRPIVASILASTWNDFILTQPSIQDTNDRFLANIQRGGTYSVVPRIPGGEITPEKLIVIGEIAKRFDLYVKITGGQRIDLLGARADQLPDVWEALVDAGFESGHAYGKAMRTVKSCVGSTWCRYGVQDSTALAIRVEERYRGLRAPHKLKSAVSGCIRECAEAQSKDFGIIATEQGWNLYVCGNGGSHPRHADLLVSDVDEATLIRLIDRFLMYYIQTANPLERTARWLERLEGGLDHLRHVVVDDGLGIAAQLEHDMQQLVDRYACEWAAVVRDPERRRAFRAAVTGESTLPFVRERGQRRPADWPNPTPAPVAAPNGAGWVRLAAAADVPRDGGITVSHGDVQIAVFHFASRGEWYATQAVCPHRKDAVLGRGLLGTDDGTPKVACPLHKKTFALTTGAGLSDPAHCIRTYPVEIRDGDVWVELSPPREVDVDEVIADAPAPAVPRDLTALRDAIASTLLVVAAVWAGSGGFAHLDAALLGYLGATLVAVFGTAWRMSTAWRRPAAAFYVRALWRACRDPGALYRTLASTGRDLAAQRFIARRSRLRWAAHMLLSLGTLASFAITLPLVFGWMRFEADGQTAYRALMVSLPVGRFVLDGAVAWLVFHGLVLAAVAVVVGSLYFLALRWRARRMPDAVSSFHTAPLLLLLAVAVTGLAMPVTRDHPDVFPVVALLHELTVVVLLVAMPFSKLGHLLIRPLQLGAQLVRAAGEPVAACAGCGAAFAPRTQLAAVEALLRASGLAFDAHQRHCPDCRRRQLASTQAVLLGAHFQPPVSGVFPRPVIRTERAA